MREDLEAILRAVDFAQDSLLSYLPQRDAELYRAGFTSAVQALAIALHIDWPASPNATLARVSLVDQGRVDDRLGPIPAFPWVATLGVGSARQADSIDE